MPLRAVCCFAHLTTRKARWSDSHYSVKKFVDALKERPIQKWADIPVGDGPRRRLAQLNASEAAEWFGEMAAELLQRESFEGRPVLVPIPSSKCDTSVLVSKTSRLAEAVAARFGAAVHDIVRFDEPQPSASGEGGDRDVAEIYWHLRLMGPVRVDRPHVLIDDVVTSGSHLMAAAALLRKHGAKVVLAVCGVSADWMPNPTPFARVWRVLPDFDPDSL